MQVQQQPSKVTQSPKKQLPILQKLSKSQKTYNVEYEIIRELRKQIGKPSECDFELFKNIYNGLSKDIKNTLAYRLLNYQIWNNQNLPVQIREKTQFFAIVSEWIVVFQMKVGDLKNLTKQIQFLNQFFIKETKDIFEKVVLIDQIHEDLVELLGREFWGLEILEPEAQPKISATKEEAVEFLKFLGNLIQYYSMFQSEHLMPVYNCQLYLLRQKSQHYKQFIFRSIEYILSVNSGKKPVQKYLQKHQEMQLTRIALIFLQRPDIEPKKSIGLLQMLMLRTSKVVRYAMVVDYVRLYNYLERSNQYQILQELENMVYFRELIIGHSQIDQAGLISNHLGRPFTIFTIPARTKQRILISHEPEFGKFSILQLQFLIEGGDISLAIYNMKNGKQNLHWKQQRTEDRRIDIMLKEEGLYIIQMDNTYSWIKPKKVSFKIEQFCIGCQGL